MEMRNCIIGLAVVVAHSALAQPSTQWQRTYGGSGGDNGRQIIALSSGGYVVAATSSSNDGDVIGCDQQGINIWLAHLDPLGAIVWQRCFGGSGNEICFDLIQTMDEGYIVVGSTNSTDGDISTPLGGQDIWALKVDSDGVLVWESTLGGTAGDQCRGVVEDLNGFIYVFGLTPSIELPGYHPPNGYDYYLAKLTPAGELVQQRCYGGSENDASYSVQISNDGQIVMTGATNSTDGDVIGGGDAQTWILAVDDELNIQWQRTLLHTGGIASGFTAKGSSNELHVLGGALAGEGELVSTWGDFDLYAVELDQELNVTRSRSYGGSDQDLITRLLPSDEGGLLSIGFTFSQDGQIVDPKGLQDAWLVSLDDTLGLKWMKNFGGSLNDAFGGGAYCSDGGIILVGISHSNDGDLTANQGAGDIWVVKLGPDGVGLEEARAEAAFRIFPNPANDLVSIEWNRDVTELQVIDALGRTVHEQGNLLGQQRHQLNVADWASGVYTIRLNGAEGQRGYTFIKY